MAGHRRTVVGMAVAGLLVAVVMGICVLAVFMPVTGDTVRPPGRGNEWIGVPPTMSVDCGPLLDPHPAQWPAGMPRVGPRAQRAADAACDEARSQQRVMAYGSGGTGIALALLFAFALRRQWRAEATSPGGRATVGVG